MNPPTNEPTGSGRDDEAAETEDLKATEDSIRADLQRLMAVEQEKRRLPADDPKVDALSDEAVALAGRVHRETRAERQLSREID